jgi:uncharacterized membrane protein YphA (DoxX/SURF4 family)
MFRLFFSSIFVLLGAEHLIDDALIQHIMPLWVPLKRVVSIASGIVLLAGGLCIASGTRLREAALMLGAFLILVTLLVHVPGMLSSPESIPPDTHWLWDVFQRSNFIKNICLLGVCIHLLTHQPGRYTLSAYLKRKRSRNQRLVERGASR